MKEQILSFLPPEYPWKDRLFVFPELDSTNNRLKVLASQGAPHGTVLIADRQTGGRGRMGRSFLSPPGVGIYMSILLTMQQLAFRGTAMKGSQNICHTLRLQT